jgi:cellulose synthase/poly-beta-1,6-N-acetylglucosamine synthase-like glycosyltransferase
MFISTLVPSYWRPAELERCLFAMARQDRAPDLVCLVVRRNDRPTLNVAKGFEGRLQLTIVEVDIPGQVHALNAGLARCGSGVVAITDDDAAPRSDWLSRIEAHFSATPELGGVGGRDWVHQADGVDDRTSTLVGRFLWFGRAVGNHHIGAGPARDVDFLKGVNCAFRAAAICPIGFDKRLRGAGAQVHNDMLACLAVKRAGWRIVYDPAIAVDHYPAPRFDNDQRNGFDAQAAADRGFNFRLALREVTPVWRRAAAVCWQHLIGRQADPGVFRGGRWRA